MASSQSQAVISAGRVVFTVGYKDPETERQRPIGVFVGLLKQHGVTRVADVRFRASGGFGLSQYNKKALRQHLELAGLHYEHFRELGNPEPRDPEMRRFRELLPCEGDQRLLRLIGWIDSSSQERVALMCACANFTECHWRLCVAVRRVGGWGKNSDDSSLEVNGNGKDAATSAPSLFPLCSVRGVYGCVLADACNAASNGSSRTAEGVDGSADRQHDQQHSAV